MKQIVCSNFCCVRSTPISSYQKLCDNFVDDRSFWKYLSHRFVCISWDFLEHWLHLEVEIYTRITWKIMQSWLLGKDWCWEGLGAGGEGDDSGWDGWMASLTRWTQVWVNSGSWWWTGRPGVLQFMGSQRIRHDWATELNWTELHVLKMYTNIYCYHLFYLGGKELPLETRKRLYSKFNKTKMDESCAFQQKKTLPTNILWTIFVNISVWF